MSGIAALAEVLQAAAGQVPVMKEMTATEYTAHLVTEIAKLNSEPDAGRKAARLQRLNQSMAVVEKFKEAERVHIPVFTDKGLPAAAAPAASPAAPAAAAPAADPGQSSATAGSGAPAGDPAKPADGDASKDGQPPAADASAKSLGQQLDAVLAELEKEIKGLTISAASSPSGGAPDKKPPAAGGEGEPGEGDDAGDGAGDSAGADAGDGDGDGKPADGSGDGSGDGKGDGDGDAPSASDEDAWPADLNHEPAPADNFGKDPAAAA